MKLLIGGTLIFIGIIVIYCVMLLSPPNSGEKRKREKERRERRRQRQKLINDAKLDIAKGKDETNYKAELNLKKRNESSHVIDEAIDPSAKITLDDTASKKNAFDTTLKGSKEYLNARGFGDNRIANVPEEEKSHDNDISGI